MEPNKGVWHYTEWLLMLIIEAPYVDRNSDPIGLLARKNGEYTRPIIGRMVDFRIEDCLPPPSISQIQSSKYMNMIGKLPNIPEIGQIDRYLLTTAATVERTDLTKEQALKYIADGHLELPSDESSEFWYYCKAPWWEFAVIFDQHDNYIKAPKLPRANEPTPDMIDELLDQFQENKGTLNVLSPRSIGPLRQEKFNESYVDKLKRL